MATFGNRAVPAPPAAARPAFGKRPAGAPLVIPRATAAPKPAAPKPPAPKPPAPERKAPVPPPPARTEAKPVRAPAAAPKPARPAPQVHTDSGFGKPVWGRRIAARLVDEIGVWLLIYIVFHDSLMASLNTYASVTPGSGAEAAALVELLGYALVFVVAQSVYNIAMEASAHQATFGKMLAGVVVTDRYGGAPRLHSVILRNTLGRFAANILPFYSGYLAGLFNAERRCVHDMVAGTVVRQRMPQGASSGYGEAFA